MQSISSYNLIISAILIILLIGTVAGFLDIWRLKKRLKFFFGNSKNYNLEEFLAQEIKRVKNLEVAMGKMAKDHEATKSIALKSLHKMGVTRFNPFNDMGGDQSFVIALLDSENNGVILSSLYGRDGSRIYAKPVIKGESRYVLSDEEKMAIKKAILDFKN